MSWRLGVLMAGLAVGAGQGRAQATGSAPAPTLQLHGIDGQGAASPFPAVNPKNFTANSPTADQVNQFLTQLWGYDPNRIWRVMSIETTAATGVSHVSVLLADRGPNAKAQPTAFYVMPDGKHAIAGNSLMDFGPKPFEGVRQRLMTEADGPAKGSANKALELVEFADMQCPHCKEAQTSMDQLAKDFPNAHIVFENFPLASIHPFATRAALDGVCVAKAKPEAFWTFLLAVYDTQGGLTAEDGEATLTAAVTKAGLDPAAVSQCAGTPEAQQRVLASVRLGESIGIDQTPTLVVNGRLVPVSPAAVSYDTLKRLVSFEAAQAGVK